MATKWIPQDLIDGIGSDNGLVPSFNKPLTESRFTKTWRNRTSLGHNKLIGDTKFRVSVLGWYVRD